jgi:uncharacterized repeat protein (TIGR02543 family)
MKNEEKVMSHEIFTRQINCARTGEGVPEKILHGVGQIDYSFAVNVKRPPNHHEPSRTRKIARAKVRVGSWLNSSSVFSVTSVVLFLLFLTFSACQDPFMPSQTENFPDGKGSFSLSVVVAGTARTILPDTPTEFASYTLVFEPSSRGTRVETERSHAELSDPVYLNTGTYKLVVTAFADENKAMARGSETITINAGLSTSKEVKLRAIIENNVMGDFTYTVIFPASLTTAAIKITPLSDNGEQEQNPSLSSGVTGTLSLNPGYYDVVVTLVKNNGNTLIWRELLHIYSNLESVLSMEFTDADFYKTKYTVIFMDGSTELINLRKNNVLHGASVDVPEEPSKNNYTFGGWYNNEECTGPQYNFTSPVVSDLILYVKWDAIPVSGVTLNKTSTSIFVGSTETLTYTVSPSNATNQNVTWESSASGVATVSNAGLVTAVGIGTATITVTSVADTSKTATCTVTVVNQTPVASDYTFGNTNQMAGSVTAVSITANSGKSPGSVGNIRYAGNTAIPQTVGTYAVTFDVAAATGWNAATNLSAGNLTVAPVLVTGVTLNKNTLPLTVGGTETLTATVAPNNATDKAVTWSISPSGVATVSNGTVTAVSAGTATITVTTADGGKTATCAVTVTCTVTFDSNGASAVASQTVGQGGKATRPSTPPNPGNAFLGWYSNSVLTALYDFGTTVTGNITLYAKWREMTADEKADFGSDATIHDIFNVSNTVEWNTAVSAISSRGSNKNYNINVIGDFDVAGHTTYTFGIASGIKVSLQGVGRKLTLSGNGNLICIAANQTVILRDLTLQGHASNNIVVVNVPETNSAFVMHSGKISGNTNSRPYGGGVCVYGNATFTMHGGEISGNTAGASGSGGGVALYDGTFTMHGGTISGNTAPFGGGVMVGSSCTFTMYGGTISGNTGGSGGGGVDTEGTFRMVTGTIYGSNASPASLRNTNNNNYGAALVFAGGTAQRGTFAANGTTWNPSGTLDDTNNTIRVVNGVLQP